MDHLAAWFEVKAVDGGQRIVEGHASVFSNVDRQGDIVDPGAFTKTLSEKAAGDVAVFVGHQHASLPVGQPLEIRPDAKGLFTRTYILPGPTGDQLLEAARKQLLGLSIGYSVRADRRETLDGRPVRRLLDVDLVEYSFAARATIANPAALVTAVKQEDAVDAKAEWTGAYINDLPDSAFAYVEPGGEKDEDGRTVPRSKRHFPHHDAAGALDLAHLRNALSRAPQSPHGARALPHLKRHAGAAGVGEGKTDDAHEDAWREGVAPALLLIAHDLEHLAERLAHQLKAMADLGRETKTGWMTTPTLRAEVRAVAGRLNTLIDRAEGADTGADADALAEWWRMQLALLEV